MIRAIVAALRPAVLFSVCFLGSPDPLAGAQERRGEEYQIKAAVLYKLTKFVEWPDGGLPVDICVLGQDPFGSSLDIIIKAGEERQNSVRPLRIGSLIDAHGCKVLFVSRSEQRVLKKLLSNTRTGGLLTVSDIDDFAHLGGMVEFKIEDQRVVFVINLKSVTEAGLHLSSKLLSLAKKIIPSSSAD